MAGLCSAETHVEPDHRAISGMAASAVLATSWAGTLDDIVGLHLARAYTVAMSNLERRLAQLALTPKAATMLWCVEEQPGVTQANLARFFKINRSYISNLTSDLIERGLLVQGKDDQRLRPRGLEITAGGMEVLTTAKSIIIEHDRWLRRGMVPCEIPVAMRVLQAITDER